MPGLTNTYVQNLGKIICGDNFLGVFSSDIQPQLKNKNCTFSVIFNKDKHNKAGSHFVAIFRDRSKFFYFDSFGKKCDNKVLRKFIKKNLRGKKYLFNKKCIQDGNSLFCGLFCLSFINSFNKKIHFSKFINKFSNTNLLLNDSVVTEMITNEIKNKFIDQ